MPRWRSVLFAPGNQPALVPKLRRARPDVAVLDLEDAVPAATKADARPVARAGVAELAAGPSDDGPGPAVWLRVNPVRSEWFADDVAGLGDLARQGLAGIVVPKVESLIDMAMASAALTGLGIGLMAGIETARGVADARDLLVHPGVTAAYFGAEDFVADMGGVRTAGNAEVAHARATVVLAARLAGIPAVDIVVPDFTDDDRFRREAAEARALGYTGKLCIHPRQVPLAHETFVPSAEEVDRARRLLAAYEDAARRGSAAIAFEGQMVDEPLATRARAVLAAADELDG
jgi:citrate lyase subunit beta/citryl-CoA lyase